MTTKDYVGIAMEGQIATWYARNVQKDIDDYRQGAKMIAARIPSGSTVLEAAPGPGYLSIELAKLGHYTITGLDISQTFVGIAQQKAREAGVSIDFRHGSVQRMPFAENTFDGLYCRAAFKNFPDPVLALNEMQRVLKPGGQAVIIDLRADASSAEINRFVDGMGLNWINTLTTKWTFKYMLLKRAHTPAGMEKLVAQSNFKRCEIQTNNIGMNVWLKKA